MTETRVPRGVPAGGQFAAQAHPEADFVLDLEAAQAEHGEHELAHLGIHTVTLPNGKVVAHNTNGPGVVCPACRGVRARQATCAECFGRGKVSNVPFCERPWDEVTPGLHLGGHDCQPGNGDCRVTDQFDVVVSLYTREGYGPDEHIPHHTHTMIDGPLSEQDHPHLHRLADEVVAAVQRGDRVLVRCQAGMNRSGLVAGLAMMKMGWSCDDAVARMRQARSDYVLFNAEFVAYLRQQEDTTRGGRTVCGTCKGHGGFFGEPCTDCLGQGYLG
ncbi:protein-tyrosine phosphatase family protein [Nocardioides pakistanensis]